MRACCRWTLLLMALLLGVGPETLGQDEQVARLVVHSAADPACARSVLGGSGLGSSVTDGKSLVSSDVQIVECASIEDCRRVEESLKLGCPGASVLWDTERRLQHHHHYLLPQQHTELPFIRRQLSELADGTSAEDLWHLNTIKAYDAWNITQGVPEVIVAVIDTGCDLTHPDLQDAFWINEGEIPGNGLDDDGNGFIDDVHGFDFAGSCEADYWPTLNCGPRPDPQDTLSHGTHIAGVIAARNTGFGFVGVAPKVHIMCLKVATPSGTFYTSYVLQALDYALSMGAHIVNMAFSPVEPNLAPTASEVEAMRAETALYKAALQPLVNKNMLMVAIAGNENTVLDALDLVNSTYNPCTLSRLFPSNVVCVMATDTQDQRWLEIINNKPIGTNYGPKYVQIGAPGRSIYSSVPRLVGNGFNSYGVKTGSPACAVVSGVAALVLSVLGSKSGDYYQASQARKVLLESGDFVKLPVSSGRRVNAFAAVQQAVGVVNGINDIKLSMAVVESSLAVLVKGFQEIYTDSRDDGQVTDIRVLGATPIFRNFKYSNGTTVTIQSKLHLPSAGIYLLQVSTNDTVAAKDISVTVGGNSLGTAQPQAYAIRSTGRGWYDFELQYENPAASIEIRLAEPGSQELQLLEWFYQASQAATLAYEYAPPYGLSQVFQVLTRPASSVELANPRFNLTLDDAFNHSAAVEEIGFVDYSQFRELVYGGLQEPAMQSHMYAGIIGIAHTTLVGQGYPLRFKVLCASCMLSINGLRILDVATVPSSGAVGTAMSECVQLLPAAANGRADLYISFIMTPEAALIMQWQPCLGNDTASTALQWQSLQPVIESRFFWKPQSGVAGHVPGMQCDVWSGRNTSAGPPMASFRLPAALAMPDYGVRQKYTISPNSSRYFSYRDFVESGCDADESISRNCTSAFAFRISDIISSWPASTAAVSQTPYQYMSMRCWTYTSKLFTKGMLMGPSVHSSFSYLGTQKVYNTEMVATNQVPNSTYLAGYYQLLAVEWLGITGTTLVFLMNGSAPALLSTIMSLPDSYPFLMDSFTTLLPFPVLPSQQHRGRRILQDDARREAEHAAVLDVFKPSTVEAYDLIPGIIRRNFINDSAVHARLGLKNGLQGAVEGSLPTSSGNRLYRYVRTQGLLRLPNSSGPGSAWHILVRAIRNVSTTVQFASVTISNPSEFPSGTKDAMVPLHLPPGAAYVEALAISKVARSDVLVEYNISLLDKSAGASQSVDGSAWLRSAGVINSMRLVGGPTDATGRLEVQLDGVWGTVCGRGFTDVEAHVACRALGYMDATGIAYHNSYFSPPATGNMPVNYANVSCNGYEATLEQCATSVVLSGDICDDHSFDVGVSCSGNPPARPDPPVSGYAAECLGPESHVGNVSGIVSNGVCQDKGSMGSLCARLTEYGSINARFRLIYEFQGINNITTISSGLSAMSPLCKSNILTAPQLYVQFASPLSLSDSGASAIVLQQRNLDCQTGTWETIRRVKYFGYRAFLYFDGGVPPVPCKGVSIGSRDVTPNTPALSASPSTSVSATDGSASVVVSMAAGDQHTCAITAGSFLVCWGSNMEGQLGIFTGVADTILGTSALRPVQIDASAGLPVSISAGQGFTCALTDTGMVQCWGALGGTAQQLQNPAQPFVVSLKGHATAIAAGQDFACAIVNGSSSDAHVTCWGSNDYGQLGATTVSNNTRVGTPVDLGIGLNPTAVAAGGSTACAILQPGGLVKCWGYNGNGLLGNADRSLVKPSRVRLGPGLAAVNIEVSASHACAVTQPKGRLKCWGDGSQGQLGQPALAHQAVFGMALPAVKMDAEVLQVATGYEFTCALFRRKSASAAEVACFGLNDHGQLGAGDSVNRDTPSLVDLGAGLRPTAIYAGLAHVCVLLQPVGQVKCFGQNDAGQLGYATAEDVGTQPNDMGVYLAPLSLTVQLPSPPPPSTPSPPSPRPPTMPLPPQQPSQPSQPSARPPPRRRFMQQTGMAPPPFLPPLPLGSTSVPALSCQLVWTPTSFHLTCNPDSNLTVYVGVSMADRNRRSFVGVETQPRAASQPYQRIDARTGTINNNKVDDWGITLQDVPELFIYDSVISGIDLSPGGPLLQFVNCTRVTFHNFTLTDLRGSPRSNDTEHVFWADDGSLELYPPEQLRFGPVHVCNVTAVSFDRFTCRDVVDAHGWACAMLEYGDLAGSSLSLLNSTFSNTSVVWGGAFGTRTFKEKYRVDQTTAAGVVVGHGALVVSSTKPTGNLTNSGFRDDSFRSVEVVGCEASLLTTTGWGAFLSVLQSTEDQVSISDTTVTSCASAQAAGTLLYADGTLGRLFLHSTMASSNNGSLLLATGDIGVLTLNDALIASTNSTSPGALLAVANLDIADITGSILVNNSAPAGGLMSIQATAVNVSSLTIFNSTLSHNTARESDGGVLDCALAIEELVLESVALLRNSAQGSGGVVSMRSCGALSIIDSDIQGNSAAQGGALALGSVGTLKISNSALVSNTAARGSGGAVSISTLEFLRVHDSSTFSQNTAQLDGGAVHIASTAGTIIFEHQSSCRDATAGRSGGCVFVGGALTSGLWLQSFSSISSCRATNGSGGGVYVGGDAGSILVSYGSTLDSCSAAVSGGAMYCAGSILGSVVLQSGSRAVNNTAQESGGVLHVSGRVSNCLIQDGAVVTANQAVSGSGGAFNLAGGVPGKLMVNASSLTGNLGTFGGAFNVEGSVSSFRVQDAVLDGNLALQGPGGVLRVAGALAVLEMSNSSVRNHKALDGGAVWVANGLGTLSITGGSTIEQNQALSGSGGAFSVSGAVGRVSITSGSVLRGNAAKLSGGFLHAQANISSDVYVEDSDCSANRAGQGGFLAAAAVRAVVFTGATFTANTAKGHGGLLYITDDISSGLRLLGTRVERNVASGGSGGAIFVGGAVAALDVISSHVVANAAGDGDGGLLRTGYMGASVVRNSTLRQNTASAFGGAMFVASGARTLEVTNTTLHQNSGGAGGVIYVAAIEETLLISDSVFSANTATAAEGGALFVAVVAVAATTVHVQNTAFGSNSAQSAGAALYITHTSGSSSPAGTMKTTLAVDLRGVQFADGSASAGGAVAMTCLQDILACSLSLSSVEALNNSATQASGGALHLEGVRASITRSRFALNTAAADGGAFALSYTPAALETTPAAEPADDDSLTNLPVASTGGTCGDALQLAAVDAAAAAACQPNSNRAASAAADVRCSCFEGNSATGVGGAMQFKLVAVAPGDGGSTHGTPSLLLSVPAVGIAGSVAATWFQTNTASSGGAVSLQAVRHAVSSTTLAAAAAAADYTGPMPSFVLQSVRMVGNTASAGLPGGGGATLINGPLSVQLADAVLEGNASPLGSGGAILCSGERMSGNGGGPPVLSMYNTTATNGSALQGGAVALVGCRQALLSNVSLAKSSASAGGCVFVAGSANVGGQPAAGSHVLLVDSSLSGCSAAAQQHSGGSSTSAMQRYSGYGGAVFIAPEAAVVMAKGTKLDPSNVAAVAGPGVATLQTMSNCTFNSTPAGAAMQQVTTGMSEWAAAGVMQLLEAATKDGCWPLALLEADKLLPRTPSDLASVRTRFLWLQDPAATALLLGCSSASSSSAGASGIAAFVSDRLAAREVADIQTLLQQCGPMNEGSGDAEGRDVLNGLLTLQPVSIQLHLDGRLVRCRRQQQVGCLKLRPGTPYAMRIELINKFGMVVTEHPPLSVEVSVGPEQLASLSSNPRAEMVRGRADFERVELEGWAGAGFTLAFRLIQATPGADSVADLSQQIAALQHDLQLLPCALGQDLASGSTSITPDQQPQTGALPTQAGNSSTASSGSSSFDPSLLRCETCSSMQYSLWQDARSADVAANSSLISDSRPFLAARRSCSLCPSNAVCPGGPVLAPVDGYWHSAPNSTRIHRCLNPDACQSSWSSSSSDDVADDGSSAVTDVKATSSNAAALLVAYSLLDCQLVWYSSDPPGADVLSAYTAAAAHGDAATNGGYCLLWGQQPANASSSSSSSYTAGVDYMQRQCAPGYQGRMCATCVSGMYLNNDFECRSCPSKAANITLGLLGFFTSVVLILYTTWTTLCEDHTAEAELEVSASDKLKVLITHMQYVVIITRLNLGWPRVIFKAQSALGSLTGAGNMFAFSPSCVFDEPGTELQARSVVLGGLALPIGAALVVMALWSLRYVFFRHSGIKRSKTIGSERRSSGILIAARNLGEENGDMEWAFVAAAPARPATAATTIGAQQPKGCCAVPAPKLRAAKGRMLQEMEKARAKLPSLLSPAGLKSSIVQMDMHMILPQQLLVVLLVALFVLYPSLVQVSLSMFACRVLDDGSGPYGSLEQATWKYGYWLHDLNMECYSGLHASLYLPLGIVCVLVFCVAPPLAVLATTMHHRARLHEERTKTLYGFLFRKYKEKYYWWETVMQFQALCLVAVDVFARAMLEYQQALLLLAVLTVIGMTNMGFAAAHAELIRIMEFASLGVLSLTITLGLYFVDTGNSDTELDNPAAEDAVGLIILVLNVGLVVLYALMVLLPSRVRRRVGRLLRRKGSKGAAAVASDPSQQGSCASMPGPPEAAVTAVASAAGSRSTGVHTRLGELDGRSGPPSVGSADATPVHSKSGASGLLCPADKGASTSSMRLKVQAAAAGPMESPLQLGLMRDEAAPAGAAPLKGKAVGGGSTGEEGLEATHTAAAGAAVGQQAMYPQIALVGQGRVGSPTNDAGAGEVAIQVHRGDC